MGKSRHMPQPQQIYQSDVTESRLKYGALFEQRGSVDCARNTRQAKYFKYKDFYSHRINKDEIMGILDMARCTSGQFIRDVHVHPSVHVVIAEPCLTSYAKAILVESTRNKQLKQLISFDTTFNLGDAYVSPLVIRNTFVVGNPIFSVAYLLHKDKTEGTHKAFWELMDEELSLKTICKSIPIVTDKEQAIRSAIRKAIPGVNLYLCHNHLFKQIKEWLGKHGGQPSDFGGILRQLAVLLNEEDEIKWNQLYEEYHKQWSKPFLDYFVTKQLEDVRKSSKFSYKKEAAFDGVIPTTNMSESENSRLSKYTGGKEVPLDVLVLALHQQQLHYLSEFDLAFGKVGNHIVKLQYLNSRKFLKLPPYAELSQEQFADLLINEFKQLDLAVHYDRTASSMSIRAANIAGAGLVSLDSVAKVFTVRSLDDQEVQSVRYDNKKGFYTCNCGGRGMCLHIRALMIAQGIEISEKKRQTLFELNTLNQAVRKGKGRSGRKRPKVGDDDFEIQEAPDSILATSLNIPGDDDWNFDFDDTVELDKSQQIPTGMGDDEGGSGGDPSSGEDATPLAQSTPNKRKREKSQRLETTDKTGWLSTSEVEDGVLSVLKEAQQHAGASVTSSRVATAIMEVPQMMENRNVRSLVQALAHLGLLEADIVLLPMNTDTIGEGSHWILGGILWRYKVVFILNSFRSLLTGKIRHKLFATLLYLACACAAMGKMKIKLLEWKSIDCIDAPQQSNTRDCGIYTILLSKAIAAGSTIENAVRDEVEGLNPRSWYETNFRSRNYRVKQIGKPLLRSMEPALKTCQNLIEEFFRSDTSMPNIIKTELQPLLEAERQYLRNDSVTCDAADLCVCREAQVKFMCVRCRRLFHTKCKTVSKLERPWPSVDFCSACKPRSAFEDFNPEFAHTLVFPDTAVESPEDEDTDTEDDSHESTSDDGNGSQDASEKESSSHYTSDEENGEDANDDDNSDTSGEGVGDGNPNVNTDSSGSGSN